MTIYRRSSPALAILVVLLLLPSWVLAQPFTATLRIHVMNVGQGDATLIIGPPPQRKTLLIDVGEEVTGRRTHFKDVAAALRRHTGKGPGDTVVLDYLVRSHYHMDHMGTQTARGGNGLWGLLAEEKIRIGTIIDRGDDVQFGPTTGPHDKYRAAIDEWKRKGWIQRRETAVLGTQQIQLGAAITIEVVAVNGNGVLESVNQARPGFFDECPPSENDYSVALKITLGAFEYFTGGDLAGENTDRFFGSTCTSYNDVETSLAPTIGNIEVMKLNHHGSSHSSNSFFMRTLAPEFIIVTSGSKNTYQHPSRIVMDRITRGGHVFLTGGVSAQEWPDGVLLPGMEIVDGDVDIFVEAGGARYEIQGVVHRAFTDAEEANRADRAYFRKEILGKNRNN